MSNQPPQRPMQTPLGASRTASRIAQRSVTSTSKPPVANSTSSIPLTSRLRRPSASEQSHSQSQLPRAPASSGLGTSGKRSSSVAGLSRSIPPSTAKKPLVVRRPESPSSPAAQARDEETKRRLAEAHERSELERKIIDAEKRLADIESENRNLQTELANKDTRIAKLESERATLYRQKQEASASSSPSRESFSPSTTTNDSVRQVSELRSQLHALQDSHTQLAEHMADTEHQLDQTKSINESLNGQLEASKQENSRLETENRNQKQQLVSLQNQVEEAQERDKHAKATLERTRQEQENINLIKAECDKQLEHYKKLQTSHDHLERRIAKLQENSDNIDILREEKYNLEKKVGVLNELRTKLAQCESERDEYKREKEEWQVYLKSITNENGEPIYTSPREVARVLSTTRFKVAELEEKIGSNDTEIHSRDRRIKQLTQHVSDIETELEQAQQEKQESIEANRKLKSKTDLDKKEIELLKQHVESYQTEEKNMMAGQYDSQKDQRISQLESLLEQHKLKLEQAQKQIDTNTPQRPSTPSFGTPGRIERTSVLENRLQEELDKNDALRKDMTQLNNSNKMLEQEVESLEIQIETLYHRLGRGEYNPDTTKVVELKDNPAAAEFEARTEVLDRLRQENKALLEKVSLLDNKVSEQDENSPSKITSDTVPRVSYENLEAENARLTKEVAQKEIARQRLSDAFRSKAKEFREAVRSLFGYSITFKDNGRVKLQSAYASNDDQSLEFASGDKDTGTMQLVSGSSAALLSNESIRSGLQFWVGERGSVPGFLASLTLEMFEMSTRGRSAGWVS